MWLLATESTSNALLCHVEFKYYNLWHNVCPSMGSITMVTTLYVDYSQKHEFEEGALISFFNSIFHECIINEISFNDSILL